MKTEKNDWYAQMVRKLQINGKSERTVQAYTRAVHQLTFLYSKIALVMNHYMLGF